MTICNMSIEAGARAGMVAPDETTYAYLKGRPHAPKGAEWDDAVAYWNTLPTDEGAVFDAEVFLDADELEPFVTWGTNPGQGVTLSDTSRPGRLRRPQRAGRRRARAGVHGSRGRDPDEGHPGRRRVHGLVHQQPHRGPAGVRLGHPGAEEGGARARHGRAGLGPRAARGGGRGPRQGVRGLRRRVAVRRLLDVPRHEPRPARPGRALRVDIATATSRAARARADAPTSCRRSSPRPPPSAAPSRARGTSDRSPTACATRARRSEAAATDGARSPPSPASRSRSSAPTSTPTRSSRPCSSSGSPRPASTTPCSRAGGRTPTSSSTSPRTSRRVVLVAGADFGTGSSREHAVWALRDYGFQAVLSPALRRHLPRQLRQAGPAHRHRSPKRTPSVWARIEAEPGNRGHRRSGCAKTVPSATSTVPFDIDDYTRWRLLEGLDDIGLTLRDEARITSSRPA